jgi:HK97 family phage major capsid protein
VYVSLRHVVNLMPQPQAPGSPVRFVHEMTATNEAAPTAETATKREFTLAFGDTSEPVRKLATFLPVSDEMLEYAPRIQAYLTQRLSLLVGQQEGAQILLGSGTPRRTCSRTGILKAGLPRERVTGDRGSRDRRRRPREEAAVQAQAASR